MSAGDVTLTDAERERLWDVIARVRDGAPRVPGDADTHDIIDGIIDSGWVYDVLTARMPTATGDDLRDRLTALVSDWQANAGSRALGDPTAATWDDAARQLLAALAGSSAPVVSRPEAVVKAEALQEAAQDYTSAADLNSHLTPESRRWLRERASVVARAASLATDAP